MSPLTLRRYRAERLLRNEFDALRCQVLASVGRRLRSSGVELDPADLEACYAMAWHGLYGAVLDGQEIASPVAWLVLVTFRRAIEEHRSSCRARRPLEAGGHRCSERDLAAELDDRRTVRQLFAALRGRLDAREREAAMLCYLHGLSRAQAAARMGVSDSCMRKLMDGRGPGRPGVARKLGMLVSAIGDGSWCEQQASLMRAFAFGVLDPAGERYRLAAAHREECPACRSYVASLRGLAAVLPPALTPWGIGAHVLASAGGAGGSISALPGAGATGAAAGASGAAAGGGWALAGGVAGKLAAGCLIALGVGAGCVVVGGLEAVPGVRRAVHHRHERPARVAVLASSKRATGVTLARLETTGPSARPARPERAAAREFGFERARPEPARHRPSAKGPGSGLAGTASWRARGAPSTGGPVGSASTTAAREFSPG